jgi:hypothetical protein
MRFDQRTVIGLAILLAQAADIYTTHLMLAAGDVEANPIVAASMAALGPGYWWLPKIAVGLVAAAYALSPFARLSWLAAFAIVAIIPPAINAAHFASL